MTSPVTYRRATPDDIPAMAAYIDGHHHPQNALPPRAAFLALLDNEVIGYIAGHVTTRHACHGEVQYLYVAPPHRRHRVATKLFHLLAQWFREQHADRICVGIDPDSAPARPFYESLGAKQLAPDKPFWLLWDHIPPTPKTGWQKIHHACWIGDAPAVAALLDKGADPNQIAPGSWRQSLLGRTLEFRITNPKHEGHVEVVKLLLQRGADPTLRSTTIDMSPYELAIFCGLEPAAKLLKRYKTSPHPTGMSPLWLAAASRLPEPKALRALLPITNPNIVWKHATPLMMATGHAGHFRVADLLLKHGADPNAGHSILHACCEWHLEHLLPAIDYLAANGWDVDNRSPDGRTALHQAALLGYAAAARALLKLHADPSIRDNAGRTPHDLARLNRKPAVARLLD